MERHHVQAIITVVVFGQFFAMIGLLAYKALAGESISDEWGTAFFASTGIMVVLLVWIDMHNLRWLTGASMARIISICVPWLASVAIFFFALVDIIKGERTALSALLMVVALITLVISTLRYKSLIKERRR